MREPISSLSRTDDIYKEIGIKLKYIIKQCSSSNPIADDRVFISLGESAAELVDLYNLLKEKGETKSIVLSTDESCKNVISKYMWG